MEPGILSSSSRTSTNHDSLSIFTYKVKELQKYKGKKKSNKKLRIKVKHNTTQNKDLQQDLCWPRGQSFMFMDLFMHAYL